MTQVQQNVCQLRLTTLPTTTMTVEALTRHAALGSERKARFLERIDELVAQRNQPISGFARAAGISRQALHKLRGCGWPKLETANRLIQAATIDPSERRELAHLLGFLSEEGDQIQRAVHTLEWLDPLQIEALVSAGIHDHELGQFGSSAAEAGAHYRHAATLFRLILGHFPPTTQDSALLSLAADAATRLSDIDRLYDLAEDSLEHAARAEQLAQRAGNLYQLLQAVRSKGIAYNNLKNYSQAGSAYSWVLTQARRQGIADRWLMLVGRDLVIAKTNGHDLEGTEELAHSLLNRHLEAHDRLNTLEMQELLGRVLIAKAKHDKDKLDDAEEVLTTALQAVDMTPSAGPLHRVAVLRTLMHLPIHDRLHWNELAHRAIVTATDAGLAHQLRQLREVFGIRLREVER
jgi:tetratricopeptide (TPR) repeat protein